jgi:hypothetical protein
MNQKSLLMMVAIAVLAITGCQKEKNKLDKRLTSDTWNLGAYSKTDLSVTNTDYISTGTDDRKTTDRNTTDFNGTTWTVVDFSEDVDGPTTSFTRSTATYDYTAEVTFSEEGTFELKITKALRTTKYEAGTTSTTDTHTNDATVETYTGTWVWGDNTSTKEVIMIDGLGTFDVELSKDELKLTRNTSEMQVTPVYDPFTDLKIATRTTSESMEETWTWNK